MELLQFSSRVFQHGFINDAVASINTLGQMSNRPHGHRSRDTGPFQISAGRSPEIMSDLPRHSGLLACTNPGSAKRPYRRSISVE